MAKKISKADKDLAEQHDPRAPLDSATLLAASKTVLARLEADLLERVKASSAVTAAFDARYQAEKTNHRTAESFAGWTSALATQVSAAWLLSCVFVRTLEDRGLLKQNRLAGPGAEDSQRQFFQLAPSLTERDYLLTVFRELAHHPAAKDLFDAEHSLVWKLSPSAEVVKELLALFRAPTSTAPAFRFGQPSTRFLGDLYQDISEDVRKRYALLQTPDFVEEFILDRTLEPAIVRFGLNDTTLIDPTCGSGHFLLGAFDRLFDHHLRAEPGIDTRAAAVKALAGVYGADINSYAVAIARFRLTLSFLTKAGYSKLAEAPALPLHLVVADSLRVNPQHPQIELWEQDGASSERWLGEAFALEDEKAARDVLFRQYGAVVGNPPYITVKDAAIREVYRRQYTKSCYREYSLSAPFCERFFQLARPRGFTGQITANSFMKREFGSRLVEEFLPSINLTFVVNTSGAYIPGHGTPTVLLFGTNDPPEGLDVPAVLAKRGEPSTPSDPSEGAVWRSIADHADETGFENDYISVARVSRDVLAKHPWSLGGGGTSELKRLLEERSSSILGDHIDSIGFMCITKQDEVFSQPVGVLARHRVEPELISTFVNGGHVRDWSIYSDLDVLFPYDSHGQLIPLPMNATRFLWPWRTVLEGRAVFGGQTFKEARKRWYEFGQIPADRVSGSCIGLASISTHNHFVYERGYKVFSQSAPIIKLRDTTSDDEQFSLIAYLNSSTACFWMKQVCFPKASAVKELHIGGMRAEDNRYEFSGGAISPLPIPAWTSVQRGVLANLARESLALGFRREELSSRALVQRVAASEVNPGDVRAEIEREKQSVSDRLVSLQEDIDWIVYSLVGLADRAVCQRTKHTHALSERPCVSRDDVPEEWASRAAALKSSPELQLLESASYKRQWSGRRGVFGHSVQSFEEEQQTAVAAWLQDQMEAHLTRSQGVQSRRSLIHALGNDDVVRVAALRSSDEPTSNLSDVIDSSDSVPFLAALRLTESGIEKYREWERTWEVQRKEDSGETTTSSQPPKYGDKDFVTPLFYRLRGKLDVPKERFISYPFCESDSDGEPVYGWAGWNHLERAKTLGALYLSRRDSEGWSAKRLTPMLAGLLELLPWLKQWHNEPSVEFGGLRMGDYYAQFLDEECRRHDVTYDGLRAWRPEKNARGTKRAAKVKRGTEMAAQADTDHTAEIKPRPRKSSAKKKVVAAAEATAEEAD